jgi:hypothetical protein
MIARYIAPSAFLIVLAATSPSVHAQVLPLPGANVVVEDSGQELYYRNETNWKLTNYVALEGQIATWSLTLQRQATSPNRLSVYGFVRIRNTGNLSAPLGNIIVNLQHKVGSDWISAAVDCADATNGDAAIAARLARGATRESEALNTTLGPSNFLATGSTATFVETAGSGALNLMDADTNTVFSMVPQPILAPGQVVNLLYTAEFDNSVIGVQENAEVRPEVLVSFGNAAARSGNGGATAIAVDINGNLVLDVEEGRVRTARSDTVRIVPALDRAHDSVTLDDLDQASDMTTTGTLFYTDAVTTVGGGTGIETANATIFRSVTAELQGCSNIMGSPRRHDNWGGVITNEAHISSPGTMITVSGAIDPNSGQPWRSYVFAGRTTIDQVWCDTADVSSLGDGFPMCVACTFTQGGWGASPNGHNPAMLLADNFATVYPSGVEVGIPGGGGFSMIFNSSTAVMNYLPAGGPPSILNADLIDPLSSSSGVFGGQVLALQINIDFAAAGLPHDDDQDISVLTLCNTGTSLDGLTLAQILAVANTVLGGGALPAGFTASTLNDMITDINESFDNCNPTGWTQEHICRGD